MAPDVEMSPNRPPTPRWARLAPPAAGALTVALGVAALVGWVSGVGALKSVLRGHVTMKANTAACFVILGVALVLLAPETAGPGRRRVGRALAAVAALVGFLTLGEYVFGWDAGIDQVLFRESPGAVDTAFPGRMALTTSASFIALGGAMALLNVRTPRVRRLSDITLGAVSVFFLSTAMAYVYGVPSHYLTGAEGLTPMAFNTAIGFLVLAFGTRIARPTLGVFALAIKEGPAGVIVRRLGPAAIASLLVLGYVHLIGEGNGLSDRAGLLLLVGGLTVMAIILIGITARAVDRAESARRQGEDERQLFFRLSLDMLCVANLDGYFVQLNPAWERTLGWSVQELMARPLIEFVHPEDREATAAEAARLGLGAETVTFENRYRCKDGSYLWLLWSTAGVPERGVLIAAARDITLRKRAEEEHSRLAAIVESAEDPIIVTALDWTITEWNRAAERMFGYTAEEAVGLPITITIAPDRPDETAIIRERVERGQRTEQFETVRRTKTGSLLDVAITLSPVLDADGRVTGLSAFVRDITERKHAEIERQRLVEEVREQAKRVSDVYNNAPIGYHSLGPDGLFLEINDTELAWLGYTRDEVLGKKRFTDLTTPDGVRTFRELFPVFRKQGYIHDLEIEMVRKDDTTFPVIINSTAITDDEGNFIRTRSSAVDITKRRSAEEGFRTAKEEAERANRAKDEFLSRTSHELRTPLNAILGFAQLLEMDDLTEEQSASAGRILVAGRHLMSLVDEMLDISRIESGELSLSMEPVDVSEVVRESLDIIRSLADERGVTLRAQDNGGFHVMADRRRMQQVVVNLLSNAVKFNREDGEVNVTWERHPDERVRLHVEDQGHGIPADQMDRVFVPFDRLGADLLGVQGTGLGLALSRSLMGAMDGSLDVASVVGRGSIFTVSLASAEAPGGLRVEDALKLEVAERAPEARTVLYIEDNPANQKLVERILERVPGVTLISAMQGRPGLELAREHRPDLILLDLHLPDMSGEDALRALRSDPTTSDIPVFVLSADAVPGTARGLLDAGAAQYVTKPIDVPRFLQLVEAILGDG